MKRALIIGTGTIAGVAAVLALNPEPAQLTASAASASSPVTSPGRTSLDGTTSGHAPQTSPSGAGTSSGTGPTSGSSTAAGSLVDVGPGYGQLQVEIGVTGGRLVDINALAVPANDPHSQSISRRAWPMLVQQALTSQSADIAGVSGATYTSIGFAQSLRAALQDAGLA